MFIKCLMFLCIFNLIDAQFSYRRESYSSCPHRMTLENGRVRLRQRGKFIEYRCLGRFTIVGNKYATCRNGEWDVPKPICVMYCDLQDVCPARRFWQIPPFQERGPFSELPCADDDDDDDDDDFFLPYLSQCLTTITSDEPGCRKLPEVKNSVNMVSVQGAWVTYFCLPGHKLVGSPVLYCNGGDWNSTVPNCVDANEKKVQTKCDFEDPNICGWTQDVLHDFDWQRHNRRTPSSFLITGPSYDHTYGKNGAGYYMYIESTARMLNDTARLISPVYDAELAKDGCFVFYYHMLGRGTGGLRVYQMPDNLSLASLRVDGPDRDMTLMFEKWGEQGNEWFESVTPLKDFKTDFQIVIEGIRGKSYMSDIAIDDVAILQGENCTAAKNTATTPEPINADSCVGRCDDESTYSNCGCSVVCIINENCCPDFLEFCVYGSNSHISDDPTNDSFPVELPQTQKLVATKTTALTFPSTIPTTQPTPTTTKISITTIRTTTTPSTTIPSTKITKPVPIRFVTKESKPKLYSSRIPFIPTTSHSGYYTRTASKQNQTTTLKTTYTTKPTLLTTSKLITTKIDKLVNITSTTVSTKSTGVPKTSTSIARTTAKVKISTKKSTVGKQINKTAGTSGPKVAIIVVVTVVVICGILWVGFVVISSRRHAVMATLRGRLRGESEVRYLTSDVDDE